MGSFKCQNEEFRFYGEWKIRRFVIQDDDTKVVIHEN